MKVEYITHSGDDLLVVNAARASFGKESEWEVTDFLSLEEAENAAEELMGSVDYDYVWSDKWFGGYPVEHLSTKDRGLINFLAREKHVLPFRHPSITLRCRAPIFVTRQLMKHQVGMTWSEESRRYISTEPEFFWPVVWRKKAENVKQGSSDEEVLEVSHRDAPVTPAELAEEVAMHATYTYQTLLDGGVAPEQARMALPQNMMVTWVWTGTLLAWHHMLSLRLADDTQKETRDFAKMVDDIITPLYPVSMQALRKHS